MHDVYMRAPNAFHDASIVLSDERFQEHVFVYAFRENTYLVTRQGIPHLAVIFAVRMLSERQVACYPDHVELAGTLPRRVVLGRPDVDMR